MTSDEQIKEEIENYNLATVHLLDEKSNLNFQVECLKISNKEFQKNAEYIKDQQSLLKQTYQHNILTEIKKHEKQKKALLDKFNIEMEAKEEFLRQLV